MRDPGHVYEVTRRANRYSAVVVAVAAHALRMFGDGEAPMEELEALLYCLEAEFLGSAVERLLWRCPRSGNPRICDGEGAVAIGCVAVQFHLLQHC